MINAIQQSPPPPRTDVESPPKGPTRGSGGPPEDRPKIPVGEINSYSPPSKDRREGLKILLKPLVGGGGGLCCSLNNYGNLVLPYKKSFFVFFFSSKNLHIFPHKKKFSFSSLKSYGLSLFTVVLLHQEILLKKKMFFLSKFFLSPKSDRSCSKSIGFFFSPFGRGGVTDFFLIEKLSQNPGACPSNARAPHVLWGGGVYC